MRKRLLGLAAAAVAGSGAVFGLASPAQALPTGCGAPNYTANWVGVTCTGGTGEFRVRVTCGSPVSGVPDMNRFGPWKATPTTAYADCPDRWALVSGSARLFKRD